MLVLIIAIYKRHNLTKVVLNYYVNLSKKYGFKIVVAGSEGNISKKIAKDCHYIEVPNFPISHKNNAMMREAKKLNPDAVVLLGSDDFICENIIKHYYNLIEQKETRAFGFKDLYFYGIKERYLSHFETIDKSFGAGRYFPKVVLDKINYLGWYGKLNKGLDGNNMNVLKSKNIDYYSIKLSDINGFLLDVKSGFNISNKNIIFVGNQVNNKIMAVKRIPKKEIDKSIEVTESKPKIKVYDFEEGKTYEVEATGKSIHMAKGKKYTLSGLEAKLLAKKGAITYKG